MIPFFILPNFHLLTIQIIIMLSIDFAQIALQDVYPNFTVGSPQPFLRSYDNTNFDSSPDMFNNMMATTTPYTISGNFGIPDVSPRNIDSNYPADGSTWTVIGFIINNPNMAKWTGTAKTFGDVTIEIDLLANTFTGTVGSLPITGTTTTGGLGQQVIVTGDFSETIYNAIFYGNISYSLYNTQSVTSIQNEILCIGFLDLSATDEFISLHIQEGLNGLTGSLPPGIESIQGNAKGVLIQQIFFVGENSLTFEGYIFPLKQLS